MPRRSAPGGPAPQAGRRQLHHRPVLLGLVRQPLISWAGDGHRVLVVGPPALHHVPVSPQPAEGLHQPVWPAACPPAPQYAWPWGRCRWSSGTCLRGRWWSASSHSSLPSCTTSFTFMLDWVRCPSATPPAGSARPLRHHLVAGPADRPSRNLSFPSLWLASAAAFFRIRPAQSPPASSPCRSEVLIAPLVCAPQ